jgi:hypothetical protein
MLSFEGYFITEVVGGDSRINVFVAEDLAVRQ